MMIPLSSKEYVEYKDTDGIVFRFVPKSGILEREQFDVYRDGVDYQERLKLVDAFIDKIYISPVHEQKPSDVYNGDEKAELIRMFNEASKLTKEEKKS